MITAQYESGSVEKSIYKIKVIDAEKLEALAAVNLKDALGNELNIRLNQDPVLGSSMSLQGLSGQNVKILVDGVPVIGRQNGNLDLSQINLNNAERIEIVEGPMAVNYGTNALAGVINIISKKPKSNNIGGSANTYYETNNNYNAGIGLSAGRKSQSFQVNIGRNYFNGWDLKDRFYLLPEKTHADTNRFKNWKPKEQVFGDIQYHLEKSKFKLSYRSAYFEEVILNRGYPARPYYETAFDDYYKTRRFDNSLNAGHKFKHFKSCNNTIAYNYYRRNKNTYYKNLTDLSEQLASDPSLQDTAVFNQWMARGSFVSNTPYQTWNDTISKINRLNYELGYDLNYNAAYGKRIKNKTQVIGDYAIFASAEIRPAKTFVIRPGLRYAYNSVYTSPLISSLNIKYNTQKWTLRASYAEGFRAPDLKELHFEFVDINHNISGNTDLKPEKSDNYNLSIGFADKKKDKEFVIETSGFYNAINDLITLALIRGTEYTYVNIGEFRSYGASMNASYRYKKFNCSAGSSLVARLNSLSLEYSTVEEYSYTPEIRGSLQYKIEKWKSSVNCFYKYTGRLPGYARDSEGNVTQIFVEGFSMLDANISKQLFKKHFTITLGAKNILNVNNVRASLAGGVHSGNSSSTPIAMGRTFFLRLQYVFEK
ncbi:MAG: TonB-dependent receptor [Bacteroidota bacterium]